MIHMKCQDLLSLKNKKNINKKLLSAAVVTSALRVKIHHEELKVTAYKTFVHSQLEYASSVCSPYIDVAIQQTEKYVMQLGRSKETAEPQ